MASPVYGFPDKRSYDRTSAAVRKIEQLPVTIRGPRGALPPFTGILLVKGTADVIKGGSGTFEIYVGDTQGSETGTGTEITGYCRMAAYTANSWAYAQPVGGKYEIAPECVS